MSIVKVTKQEFKDAATKYASVFLLVTTTPMSERNLAQSIQQVNTQCPNWERRRGKLTSKGICFFHSDSETSYLDLVDDPYNKREVYRYNDTGLYFVKQKSQLVDGVMEKYMYYYFYM